MRPTPSVGGLKTELRLTDLIQDQTPGSFPTSGDGCSTQDAIRTALLSGVAPLSNDSTNNEKQQAPLFNLDTIKAILTALTKVDALKDGSQLGNQSAGTSSAASAFSDPAVSLPTPIVPMETATSNPISFSSAGLSFPSSMCQINTNTLEGITLPNGKCTFRINNNNNHQCFLKSLNLIGATLSFIN